MSEILISEQMPVLALRGLTVFPRQMLHFDVGREKSIRALEHAMKADQRIFLVTQRDILDDEPTERQLFPIGTVAKVKQVLRMQGDLVRILVEGEYRACVTEMTKTEPCLFGRVESVEEQECDHGSPKAEALMREAVVLFDEFLDLLQKPAQELQLRILASHDPGYMADTIGQHATFGYTDKAKLLAQLNPVRRLDMAVRLLRHELEILKLESEMQDKTREQIDKGQRDYYLREQMKVIRTELGEEDDEAEAESYRQRIQALQLTAETEEKLLKDVGRLTKQPYGSSEGAVLRGYLDTILELPWNTRTKERLDMQAARKILDEDHFGLEKVKERILEILAVKKLAPELPGQIICLVGPPGVGKTSIAYSIARCLNRKMARISLGGVHDEAEIRGHRKTYVGAMPGRIMTALAQAGSRNALLLLDEVDKMGTDYRGDPSSALLEVLDGEQNSTYRDHYLEVPFDLSECMFITTANTTETIPRPLLDRMEVIELGSYTDEEKLMIVKNHLLPKQLKKHGIKRSQLRLTDDCIREIITCYTRESGVRNLERELGGLCRKADMRLVEEDAPKRLTVTGTNLEQFLGVRKYLPDQMPPTDPVGLVTGLAWTAVGGETLEVEVNVMEGSGKLELTGNLGDVMKESAHAALSYIRSRAEVLGISDDFYKTKDIHVHFPEGAIPKDGPSAGVTVCTAMVSALLDAPVRRDIAMTGEISIRGRVLPIGGLKEKTMAALRHGVKTVIIPQANQRDLEEIDQTVRKSLNFITAAHVDTVLETALTLERPVKGLPVAEKEDTPIPVEGKKSRRKPAIRQ